ncbi:MAG: 2-octaprenyl-3-methyl-6-methoxy-1,4-benzoquinol hydroxylase [Oleiphilaceae bacterium]|jgi:2-octaprenyl-3-methyl-6-methoxy-1,4-benzoquinol hydroxylase
MSHEFDVLIVGAGMIGATIACGLARSGLNIGVIDQQPPPEFIAGEAPHIRVSALSFASEQVLRHVGAWPFIANKRVCPYRRLAVNERPSKKGLSSWLPDISTWARTEFNADDIFPGQGEGHLGHIVENDIVQLGLHETMAELDNIQLFCPDQIVSMQLQGEQKTVNLAENGQLKAKLVIGADGAQSKVRQQANIGQFREQYDQQAFVCTVEYQGKQEDITWQSFTSHGPMAFLPLADSRTCAGSDPIHYASLVWYDAADAIKRLKTMSDAELLTTLQRKYPKELPTLNKIVARASFPLFKSHALDYVKEGVVIAGDAAHTINPLAGQGVNLGFLDAAVLIEVVAQAVMNNHNFAAKAVLDEYQKRRRSENQTMMRLMDAFYYGFSNDHLPLRIIRNLGLGLANHAGVAKHSVVKYAIGLSGELPKLAKPV